MPNGTNNGTLEVRTKLGTIAATGATVFIVVSLSLLTGIAIWEHAMRQKEHEIIETHIRSEMELIRKQQQENIAALVCSSKLNLFFQTIPKGKELNWSDIPSEYWGCMPRNLIDERKQQVR